MAIKLTTKIEKMKRKIIIVIVWLIYGCKSAQEQPLIDASVLEIALHGVNTNADWVPYFDTINGVEMALVPSGCFLMGSEDGHGTGGEEPIHKVCFIEPFWLDVYEVTQNQFARLEGEAESESCFEGGSRPRECVTWYEAKAFCELRGARLPKEAEWEYAARGPDGLRFPWGNDFVQENTVYPSNSRNETAEVGSKPGGVSWIGVYDLSGNVWEWVYDWYGEYYFGTLEDGTINPQGPENGTERVLRGGSWITQSVVRRIGIRYNEAPEKSSSIAGFRCALTYQP